MNNSIAFDFLLPDFSQMETKKTKAQLTDDLKEYEQKEYKAAKERSKTHTRCADHWFFSLAALKSDLTAFRFVINLQYLMILCNEEKAGIDTPSHYQASKIISFDQQPDPEDYWQSNGCKVLGAGRFFILNNIIVRMDHNSGGFRPDYGSMRNAIMILLLCAPKRLGQSLIIDALDRNGHVESSDCFTIKELKEICFPKFTSEEKQQIIQKNSAISTLHFVHKEKRIRAREEKMQYSDSPHKLIGRSIKSEADKENILPNSLAPATPRKSTKRLFGGTNQPTTGLR